MPLNYEYLISESTIRKIVFELCSTIWTFLRKIWIPEPTENKWLEISEQFYKRTNFPNYLGAIDGKYIRIKMLPFSGSEYYNFKNISSFILLAVVDADYSFIFVDVGHSEKIQIPIYLLPQFCQRN